MKGETAARALAFPILVTLLLAARSTPAATVYLTPSADTTLLENFPTNNLGGQGWMNAGTTQNYTRNRALIRFDLAPAIPANARITAASLTVHVTRSPVDGDLPSTFDLHRLLQPWGEGNKTGQPPLLGAEAGPDEATWTHRFAQSALAWHEPGGAAGVDFAASPSADTYVYGENFSPYLFDSTSNLVADVQRWLDDPAANFGWLLKTRSESDNFSARRFGSREALFLAPTLAIDYTVTQWERIAATENRIILELHVAPEDACTVEAASGLEPDGWSVLTNIPPAAITRVIRIDDPMTGPARFYRLR